MSRRVQTIEAAYFDALYSADADPWRFRTSGYERDKYRATLNALSRDRYGDALEVGCANGVFTGLLARRCDRVTAMDASQVALDLARKACAGQDGIRFLLGAVPGEFPEGAFDLIVLSEVLYYMEAADVARVAQRCRAALQPDGDIVLCHWLGETDYPLTGHEAADLFVREFAGEHTSYARLHDDTYRLERLTRHRPVP
jgi:SAM-dependent methyltransferase